jgi:hypothetical protein
MTDFDTAPGSGADNRTRHDRGSAEDAGFGTPWPRRPQGMTDETVQALGKLSEALETIEYARGQLYEFHRRSGTADRQLQEARDLLLQAGHAEVAAQLEDGIIGRDVIPGLWTFQIVDNYDAHYWSVVRDFEQQARSSLGAAKHIYEAEMKQREQS